MLDIREEVAAKALDDVIVDEGSSAAEMRAEAAEATSATAEATVEERVVPVTDAAPNSAQRALETPHSAEIDIPNFRPRKRGRAAFGMFVASAVAIAGASVAWSRFASHREHAAVPAPERATERAPARPSPEPLPPPVAPATNEAAAAPTPATNEAAAAPTPATNEAAAAAAPVLEGAVAAAPDKASTTVTVTVKVVPEGAVIFRAGKRIGSGVVEVSVERNVKQRFTALHDGYRPSNFVLDGSRDSITIMLKRAPKPRPAATAPSDSPYDDIATAEAPGATAAATAPAATTASAATAAPTTAGTTEPAPAPEPAPTESSPQ